MKALFSHAVWGKEYIANFLQYSLPTQLSKGNLLTFGKESVFLIDTLEEDIPQFEDSPAIRKLKDVLTVEIRGTSKTNFSQLKKSSKYSILTHFQNGALRYSRNFDAVFFGYADALWADGTFRAAAERIADGYDAVFSPGYPVIDAEAKARLDAAYDSDDPALELGKRDFARMVFDCLHPMAKANISASGLLSETPSYLFWTVDGQGLLMRAFHIHPVAFRVRNDSPDFLIPFRTTLDEEFVARLSRYRGRLYVSPTSDEMAVCSLMPLYDRDHLATPPRSLTATEVAIFGEAHAGLVHRELALRSVRLQYADGDEAAWQDAERKATRFIDDVMLQLNTPDTVIELESPWAFRARKLRQETYRHWNDKEELILLASQLFTDSPRKIIIRSYIRKLISSILMILHNIKFTGFVRRNILPLLGRNATSKVESIIYDIGNNNKDQVENELMKRLPQHIKFREFFHALVGLRY